MRLTFLAELLEHMFVISCHLTRVALNPAGQNNIEIDVTNTLNRKGSDEGKTFALTFFPEYV